MNNVLPYKLGNLCNIQSGGTPSRRIKEYYNGTIPWVKIRDIENSNGIIFDTEEHITKEGLKSIGNRIFSKGTLLLSMYGSVGKVAFCGVELSTNQAILGISIKSDAKELLDLNFLYYWVKINAKRLQNRAVGGILKNLSATIVKNLSINLPSLTDQKRIAKVLSDCEQLIAWRKESIRLLDDYLESVFLEMFGDPVKNEKGWETVPLSKLGKIDRGVSKHRPRNAPELLNGEHPLIQTGDVSNSGTYITEYKQTYSDIGLKQSKKWPAGTLCITIAANIAKTGILKFEACFPDSVVGFVVDENEATNLYVHHLFSFFQMILEKNAPAAAQKNINLGILRALEVPKPPIDLQREFNRVTNRIENVKNDLLTSLQELENLHASLSQKAFKGELDLSKVEVDEVTEAEREQLEQIDRHETESKKVFDKKAILKQAVKRTQKVSIRNLSFLDYLEIPYEFIENSDNWMFDFTGMDEFYQFLLKDNFPKDSFTFGDIEAALYDFYYHKGNMDFDQVAGIWKDVIFKFLSKNPPLLKQIFDKETGKVKLKLTDEAFEA
jgi:type I restriction enzyme S subunit